jgi:hypothetical protein
MGRRTLPRVRRALNALEHAQRPTPRAPRHAAPVYPAHARAYKASRSFSRTPPRALDLTRARDHRSLPCRRRASGRPIPRHRCNALNLGVEFFLLFSHQIRALLSFLFPRFAPSTQFQTSIATGVRVMYKPKPKYHGCCIMPKHISLSDVQCSARSVPDFDSRFNSV